jgi:tRNA 2-selenouridine synthase
MIIVGGLTGSGKTRILANIRSKGHRVTDLEGLASHRGSAFGSLGQPPQPTSEHFANLLYHDIRTGNPDMPLWLEDESRNIGNVFMPGEFYLRMQENPVIVLMMDIRTRLPRLLEEYSGCSQDELISSVMKISKRLGGDRTKEAVDAIAKSDFRKAIEITLQYYDKSYLFGLGKKNRKDTFYVNTDTDDIEANTEKILRVAQGLRW